MIVIIDNGHGGINAGKYQTPPQNGKFYVHHDGTTIHEGEFNRAIKARVLEQLYNKGIPYFDLVPEQIDIPLSQRTDRANLFHDTNGKKTFLISIHSDAGGGAGSTAFVQPTSSQASKDIANIAEAIFKKHFPFDKHRGVREKNLAMTRDTKMPAVLLENFFMDNYKECTTYLKTKEGRDRIATYIVDIIETYIKSL